MSFKNAKAGDKVICLLNGEGDIIENIESNRAGHYPIGVKFLNDQTESYTIEGKISKNNINPCLFYLDKDGDKCVDRPEEERELPFYFTTNVGNTYKVSSYDDEDNLLLVNAFNTSNCGLTYTENEYTINDYLKHATSIMTQEEFEEKFPIPWERVPKNTKVLVKCNIRDNWTRRYYSGKGRAFMDGCDSWTINDNIGGQTTSWEYMELAEDIIIDNTLYEAYKGETK